MSAPTRKSIDEHRESRDPNHPRDFIDCYLNQVMKGPGEKELLSSLFKIEMGN